MKPIVTLILLFAFPMTNDWFLFSQSQWQRRIGGTSADDPTAVIRTNDDGYVIAGTTRSSGAGSDDAYIVKLDANGLLQWSKTVGGANSERASAMTKTADGGYVIAGSTTSFGAGNSDMYIVKLDANGSFQWNTTVGGSASDGAGSIIQTTDGGYAVAGGTDSFGAGGNDIYIIKLDSSGVLQWARTVGGTLSEGASSIVQTTDGGYVVAGTTFHLGSAGYDMYVVRLSSSGSSLWCRAIGGIGYDGANSMIRSEDGGYVLAGWGQPTSGINDMYVVKLDSSGSLLWSERVGTTRDDWANSIFRMNDGGYIVAGQTQLASGTWDCYVVKLNAVGTLLATRTVGGTGDEYAYSVIPTTDSGYVVAGSSASFGAGQSDFYVAKFGANLNTCGNSGSPATQSVYEADITTETPTVMLTTPTVTTPTPTLSSGGTVTTLCSTVGVIEEGTDVPRQFTLDQNYPNPFNPTTVIRFSLPSQDANQAKGRVGEGSNVVLKVYDLLGREVATLVNEVKEPGSYEVTWDASGVASGVYLYKLRAGAFTETKKLILLR